MLDISNGQQDLFVSLAEQVKLPFLQIANTADLLILDQKNSNQAASTIKLASTSAIQLIDSYLLSVELGRQQQLQLEPVSISSVMFDVASSMNNFAKLHGCRLDLDIVGRYGPVMANKRALVSALSSLSTSFIEATSSQGKGEIKLVLRKNRSGVNVGIFSDVEFSSGLLEQAKKLKGRPQPLSDFDSSTGIGVFLADELFSRLNSEVKVARHKGRIGLAATFTLSNQLSLV